MTAVFNLTPRAREYLRGIWQYTAGKWGEAQADKYITALYHRFAWLAQQPHVGKHRPDIQAGYCYFPQASHLVFYLIRDAAIDIIGTPHKEMDILSYFDN